MKHNKFRSLSRLVLLTLALLILLSVPAMAVSGNLAQSKPTKDQLRAKWQQVTTASTLYQTTPSIQSPYAAGSLTDDFLQSGITYLNYVRYAAGLPAVRLDATLNADAQHGAVVLAAIDTLTHYPTQPSGMSSDFYNRAYAATTSSNISARWGYNPLSCLQGAVSGCMADNSSQSNLAALGHRRWLLNPTLLNVGFGYAHNEDSGWDYIVTKVFDNSGSAFDYDYIAWPASGNFPTNLFSTATPWSITLNPSKYQTPSASQVKITITRQSDGKTWSFSSATGQPTTASNAYMTVENSYYGIPNCIIFNPGSANVDSWVGVHTVSVSGIQTRDGKAATLDYQVDFFSVEPCSTHSYTSKVTAPTCGKQGYTTYTCSLCGHSYTGNTVAATGKHTWDSGKVITTATCVSNGVKQYTCTVCGGTKSETVPATGNHNYTATNTVAPTCDRQGSTSYTCTVCGKTKQDSYTAALGHSWAENLCTRCGVAYGEHFTDVPSHLYYFVPVKWAAQNGITTGITDFTFAPDSLCTRAQAVTFLWRAYGSPMPTTTENPFSDVKAGTWYYNAVLWAVENEITNGMSFGLFGTEETCTRAQVATFLHRAAGNPAYTTTANPFKDVKQSFYYDAVLWAVERGITNGDGAADTFNPDGKCTRGQIVTFLYRALN